MASAVVQEFTHLWMFSNFSMLSFLRETDKARPAGTDEDDFSWLSSSTMSRFTVNGGCPSRSDSKRIYPMWCKSSWSINSPVLFDQSEHFRHIDWAQNGVTNFIGIEVSLSRWHSSHLDISSVSDTRCRINCEYPSDWLQCSVVMSSPDDDELGARVREHN